MASVERLWGCGPDPPIKLDKARGSLHGFWLVLVIYIQRGKFHLRPHGRMMRERRVEPLTYKSFVIQTWPMGHIVCGRQLFTLKMNFLGQNGV